MGITNVILEKPSKIHNLSYFLLGYYLTTLITYKLDVSFEESIFLVTTFGSFFGALLYYIKPVERIITTYFKIFSENRLYVPEMVAEFTSPIYKSEVLFSQYLDDERTIINGAIFLSIGLFLSDGILKEYNFLHFYFIAQLISFLLICAGLWEIFILIKRKMPSLIFYYNFLNYSEQISELESALKNKDWIKAEKIRDKEWHLEDPETYMQLGGSPVKPFYLCPECFKIYRSGKFCIDCGSILIQKCPICEARLIYDDNQPAPKYCKYCGNKIEKK